MTISSLANNFNASLSDLWGGVITVLPLILIAVILFAIGWIIASLVASLIEKIFVSLKVDTLLKSSGLDEIVKKTGYNLNSGKFIGGLVKWFIIVVFLMFSLGIVGLNDVNSFLQGMVVEYLPKVIVAVLMLLVAAVVAGVAEKFIVAGSKATSLGNSHLLGAVAKWSIWIAAIMTVMYQLGIVAPIIQTIITGVVFALALALGLSFGIGGKDVAKEILEKIKHNISSR